LHRLIAPACWRLPSLDTLPSDPGLLATLMPSHQLKRREFICVLGSAAVAWPFASHAQQAGRLPIIGFLGTGAPGPWHSWTVAFEQRLRELGWIEGRTVEIRYRWGEGHPERFDEIAAEFVRLKADIIVTAGSAVPAVKRATLVIPIVFAVATDPLGGGLVASLSRPGGNVTGLSDQQSDVASKRLELLRQLLPDIRRLAILANAGYPVSVKEMSEVQTAARKLDIEVIRLEIRRAEDIAPAFESLQRQTDAIYIVDDGLVSANSARIATFAQAARLPAMFSERAYVEAGALMSYGPTFSDLFRRTAEFVDKILRGAKPGNLPVEQPTKFEFVINLRTAKAIGLTVPGAARRSGGW
jgi:putative tryptophan/tyrosine transport system substrate-binding protein